MTATTNRTITKVQEHIGEPIADYLLRELNHRKTSDVAAELGWSQTLMSYYMTEFGIQTRWIALQPGEAAYAVDWEGKARYLTHHHMEEEPNEH